VPAEHRGGPRRRDVACGRVHPDRREDALPYCSRQTINAIEEERYTPSLPLAITLAHFSAGPSRRS
jgi:hypothetical protein